MATLTTMTTRKNKSLFPVHFALIAMQLCVRAFCSPSGIEPLTLVPACLALDHKTREDTMIVFFSGTSKTIMTTVTSPWPGLGQPLFEMCWVYMAIAQIAQDPPLCQTDKCGKKSVPNHPGKPLHPRANL